MSPALIDILNVLIEIAIAGLVIITPIGIVGGIILATQISKPQNAKRKNALTGWMIVSFVAPIVLLFVTLSIWGFFRIFTNTYHV